MKGCIRNQINKLVKEIYPLEYAKQNMYIYYTRSEGNDEVYLVYFDHNYRAHVDMIVYWNGARILYQRVSMPTEWEPKKSLKDECLGLIKDAVEIADSMIIYSDKGCDRRNKLRLCIDKLNDTLNKMKDNT